MGHWTKTTGLLFLAAVSVYAVSARSAAAEKPGTFDARAEVAPTTEPAGDLAATSHIEPAALQKADAPKVILNEGGTFSIQINTDTNVIEVLRMIGSQNQVSVIPSKEVHGTVPAMDLYNVTVPEALDAILKTNGMAYRQKGNFLYVYSQKELADMDKAARMTGTEVFHLYYTPASNAVNMIKPVLSPDAQVSFTSPALSGLATGTGEAGGNSHAGDDMLVITDYPENLSRVKTVLKEIDRRPQEILVEATILRATLNENNALGIDFTVLGGTDFTTLMSPAGAATNVGTALTGNILNTSTAGPLLKDGYAGSNTSFSTQVPQGGLKLGVVHSNLALFLQALESVTDTTILANPKVLALDKQKGEVIVGRQDGYLTTTTTQTASTQTVEFLETGTRLVFRPYVGDDGYIRMEIHPEDSSGGLTSTNLPFKVTTEITSNVMVKDGNTIVIGGLFRESSQVSKAQVPFLGDIPWAGALFRQQQDTSTREEVIILLTPHIVKDDTAYSNASEQELKEIEKLRVGVRREMMPSGRERLAESAYECAQTELKKPHPDIHWAIWYLDCATNLNPFFTEAIDLKEKLTGQAITLPENSTIRGFVRRQIMAERGMKPAMIPSTAPSLEENDSPAPPKQVASAATPPVEGQTPTTNPQTETGAMVPRHNRIDVLEENDPLADGPATSRATQPDEQPEMGGRWGEDTTASGREP